jgi:septum formation protein
LKGGKIVKSGRGKKREWILASASPRRCEILRRLGLEFCIDPSGIVEPEHTPSEKPSRYAVRIARLKAKEVAKRHASGLILSADTIVVLENGTLAKPKNRAEARSMLKRLSGRWHEVISGICLLNCDSGLIRTAFSSSRIHFRRLSSKEIEWYLKTGEYRDKAGAYGAQGYASLFIDRIEGCYFNVVGFPVAVFERLCHKAGIDLIQEIRLTK